MDPTSSNKGKGLMDAISSNPPDKRFKVPDGKSLNLAPPPIARPYNPDYPLNASIYGEPLNIRPLTVAEAEEPVVPTPACIKNHEVYEGTYKGGWKVLQTCRPNGRVDKTYKRAYFGTFRSMRGVLTCLDKFMNNKKNSSDQDKQGSGEGKNAAGPSQSAQGKGAAAYNEAAAEANSGAAYNKAAEGNSAAGASYSAKRKSAA